MKRLIILICCNMQMISSQDSYNKSEFEDILFTPVYQPILNGGRVPLPGDTPVLNRKIFRGVRVTINEHPYMASIRRQYSHYLCGVIISQTVILTVAHPLENVPIYEVGVVVGESYSDRGTSIRPAIFIAIHEDFDPYKLTGDLALIRIYTNLQYRTNIKSVCALADAEKLYEDDVNVFVTGWGRCDLTGKEMCLPRSSQYYPDEKMDPMLKTISIKANLFRAKQSCSHLYKRVFGLPIDDSMLCLGYMRENFPSSPCIGVPGAVALVEAKLLGLQSWGFGCGYKNDLPVVYTDVRNYQDWIFNSTRILHTIPSTNLTFLYEMTISKSIYDWFNQTRVRVPEMSPIFEEDIQMLPIDLQLAAIKGKVYDMRDYVLDGRFSESKQNNIEIIRTLNNMKQKKNDKNKLKIPGDATDDEKIESDNIEDDKIVVEVTKGRTEIEPFLQYSTVPMVDSDYDSADNY